MRLSIWLTAGGLFLLLGCFGAQADVYRVYGDAPDGPTGTPGEWGFKALTDAWNHATVTNPGDHTIQLETLESGSTQNIVPASLVLADSGSIIVTAPGLSPEILPDGDFPVFRNLSTTGKTLTIQGNGSAIYNRIALQTDYASPLVDCGDNPTGDGVIILENVNLIKKEYEEGPPEVFGAPDGNYLRIDNRASGTHQVKNVSFLGGDRVEQKAALLLTGPKLGDTTLKLNLEYVDFSPSKGAGIRVQIVNVAEITADSCTFRPAQTDDDSMSARAVSAAPVTGATPAPDGGTLAVFKDCSFESGESKLFSQLGIITQATPNRYVLYNPVFTGKCGGSVNSPVFDIANSGARVEILGLDPGADLLDQGDDAAVPGHFADMDGLTEDTGCYARMLSGALRFDHVKGTVKPSYSAAITSMNAALEGDVIIDMDFCEWANGAGTYYCRANGGAFAPKITIKNTLFRGGNVACYINTTGYNETTHQTGPAEIYLQHVTLTCSETYPVTDMLVKGQTGDALYCAATIFDAPVASNLAPGLKTGFEWNNLAWNRNDAGGLGGFTPDPVAGFIFADPKIDELTGKLTTGSGALSGAASSGAPDTTDIDLEGDPRPLPAGFGVPDIGADEAEFGPTDILINPDPAEIGDDAVTDDPVCTLTLVDPDPGDTASFLLVDGAGGRFKLSGNQILVDDGSLLDAGVQSSHIIDVWAEDSTHKTVERTFTISVVDRTGPHVTDVAVTDFLTVQVTFSEPMMALGLNEPAHYALSGTGQGTLADNPDSVTILSDTLVQLGWNAGEMRNLGDITITVSDVYDLDANLIAPPVSGTHVSGGAGATPPSFYGIVVQGDDRIDVYFSEPMLESGLESALDPLKYLWWEEVSGPPGSTPATVQPIASIPGAYSLLLPSGSITENQTIVVSVAGVTDLAGNPIDPNDPGCPNYPDCLEASYFFEGSAPRVTGLVADSDHSLIIKFNEPMGDGDITPANYTLSGPAANSGVGSLAEHPDQVVRLPGSGQYRYRLIWNSGEMFTEGSNQVQITVTDVHDLAGILIDENFDSRGCASVATPPVVSEVRVIDMRTIKVIFSEPMQALHRDSIYRYTLSGPGKGTLSLYPNTVVLPDEVSALLKWNNGSLTDGEDVTIDVLPDVRDLAGNALGTPSSGTVTDRIAINISPSGGKKYAGQPFSFTVQASSGVGGLHYAWSKQGAKLGDDSPVLSFSAVSLADAGAYVCAISDSREEVVTTDPAFLEVHNPLVFEQQPEPVVYVTEGGTLHLSVVISGGIPPISYQWKRDGVNVGADSPNLEIASITTEDGGDYVVEVTDYADTYVSSVSKVTCGAGMPLLGLTGFAGLITGIAFLGGRMARGRRR